MSFAQQLWQRFCAVGCKPGHAGGVNLVTMCKPVYGGINTTSRSIHHTHVEAITQALSTI
eukprot:scaffold34487_cov80-Skeletonema_marinoi.AAC.2